MGPLLNSLIEAIGQGSKQYGENSIPRLIHTASVQPQTTEKPQKPPHSNHRLPLWYDVYNFYFEIAIGRQVEVL